MKGKKPLIKHLEMIQNIITRMARNSFLIKGWSLTILSAALLFITQNENVSPYILLCFIVPIVVFWGLDGFFLWQERLFRKHYDCIRKQKCTDFGMDTCIHRKETKWGSAVFSITLFSFYVLEIVFIIITFRVLCSMY